MPLKEELYEQYEIATPSMCIHGSYSKYFKWKVENNYLWYISEYEIQRFGELRRRLGDITQSTLTKQLRELEQDGFISRYVYQEVPPKVEYSLTDLGKSFVPILQDMKKWSDLHLM